MVIVQLTRSDRNNLRLAIYMFGMLLATVGAGGFAGPWAGLMVLGLLISALVLFEKFEKIDTEEP